MRYLEPNREVACPYLGAERSAFVDFRGSKTLPNVRFGWGEGLGCQVFDIRNLSHAATMIPDFASEGSINLNDPETKCVKFYVCPWAQ